MKHKFLLCGAAGWCMEILWTGIHSLERGERKLLGQSSIWMFPIYGMAAVISPISRLMKDVSPFIRGSIYTVGIFFTEYTTGSILKKYQMCPWDYSKCKLNYKGLIRLDYAPVWFFTGLIFEKILSD
ncbi:hypothetical protein C3B58_18810 [Lactonifactor longoviformis]|uniref:Putative ABC-transporter type IV n=1 Tax=Lactonifactor longoviformis DSM 17459 TaxID=1122155 RepID=A0A1M5D8W7_9CLOT|nr:hypothetical protein [Lactonifactor longoviformis]POP30929.1 hypothetical protein C3B58_18810 [Lactonifactor longoviformis]SHF63315.1 Putative ABC-transporter type IV [Lactonifactor longoviformis DSM 17459]